MSVVGAQPFTARNIQAENSPTPVNNAAWARPTDWLAVNDIADGTQQVTILCAVWPQANSNYVAFTCAGNYTVNWGDGLTENISSGVQANHSYDYTNSALDGTLTSRGYKQALITITPNGAANLTSINLQVKNNSVSRLGTYSTGYLDMILNVPNATAITIGASSPTVNMAMLERIRMRQNNLSTTAWNNMAYNCYALRSFEMMKQSAATSSFATFFFNCYDLTDVSGGSNWRHGGSASQMFNNCHSLVVAPWMDLSGCTNTNSMFNNCYSLTSVPAYAMTANQNAGTMFGNCYSLKTMPLISLPNAGATTMGGLFQNCFSLSEITANLNIPYATNTLQIYDGCRSLQSIPDLQTTSALTATNQFFQNCSKLISAPNISNTANVTNFAATYNGCYSLVNLPSQLDMGSGTNTNAMFANCVSINTLPATSGNYWNFSKVTDMTSTFSNMYRIRSIPSYSFANATALTNVFNNNLSLAEINATSIRAPITLPAAQLSKASIEAVFANLLPRTATANTITLGSNPGTDTAVSLSATSTAGSITLTMANTVGLSTGMVVTGANINSAITVTANTTNVITSTNHQLAANTLVSFNGAIGNTAAYTPVYVVNPTTNDFQITNVIGGSIITITANSTPTMNYGRYIANIVANTSVTLTTPASSTGTGTVSFRILDTTVATLKNWTVSG